MGGSVSKTSAQVAQPVQTAQVEKKSKESSCKFLEKWDPRNWDADLAKRVAKLAALIFFASLVGMAIYTLIPGAYYTIFGLCCIVSLLVLCVSGAKYCKEKQPGPADAADAIGAFTKLGTSENKAHTPKGQVV